MERPGSKDYNKIVKYKSKLSTYLYSIHQYLQNFKSKLI